MKKILLFSLISISSINTIFGKEPNVLIFESLSDLLHSTSLVVEYILHPERRAELDADAKDIIYTAYWLTQNAEKLYKGNLDGLVDTSAMPPRIKPSNLEEWADLSKFTIKNIKHFKLNTKKQEKVIKSINRKEAYRIYKPVHPVYNYQEEVGIIPDFLDFVNSINQNNTVINVPKLLTIILLRMVSLDNIGDYITIWGALFNNLNKNPEVTLSNENINNIASLTEVFSDKEYKKSYAKSIPNRVQRYADLCTKLNIPLELNFKKP